MRRRWWCLPLSQSAGHMRCSIRTGAYQAGFRAQCLGSCGDVQTYADIHGPKPSNKMKNPIAMVSFTENR